MNKAIHILQEGNNLKSELAREVLLKILTGNCLDSDVENFLIEFESKPYHWEDLIGFIQAMKESCISINKTIKKPVMDVCGTGGSGKNRFNISTAAVFVLAAAGIHVAKHGNYGSKRPNGSFNFLEEMNIPFQFNINEINTLLKESKCCFLFARYFHPGMRHVVNARKKIGKRTVFNILGPLANPIDLDYQLIGLSSEENMDVLIDTVKALSLKKVMFCIGGDGRDEVSLLGKTKLIHVENKTVKECEFDFSKEIEKIKHDYECGDSHENALTLINIFIEEDWEHPIIKHISINVAAALLCAGQVSSLVEGYEKSNKLFKSGAVVKSINHYKKVAAELK
tara:strand:+ start:7155 stop:8171 length:1017 start_codon:yes stop_codon:yes gene_type:complete